MLASLLAATAVTPVFPAPAFAASYQDEVLADNPIAYYRLNETGGNVIVDYAGANHGTYEGAPAFSQPGATGDGDTAVTFDDTAGAAGQIPRTIQDDFTIELWVKTTSTRNHCGFAWYCGAPLVDAEMCSARSDFGVSVLGGRAAFGVGPHDSTIFSTTLVNDDIFHHVVATRRAATGSMQLYVDGLLEASVDSPSTESLTDAPYIGLGSNPCLRAQRAAGDPNTTLDDVALYTTVLSEDRVADHFSPRPPVGRPMHTLTVTRGGTGQGIVTSSPGGIDCGVDCSEQYEDWLSVTLTAAPSAGSELASWGGACEGTTGNRCVVPMSVSRTVTVSFSATRMLTIEKAGSGAGEVTSAPSGIECGTDCTQGFTEGEAVTLEAVASADSTFVSWSGCDEVAGDECSVTMSSDRTATATFGVAQVRHARDITLELRGHLRATGHVTVPDGFTECAGGALVKVQRRKPGTRTWVTVARLVTDAGGAFTGAVGDLARSYRARVPASAIGGGPHSCANALSPVSSHRHRDRP
jgi:hypothetical protein